MSVVGPNRPHLLHDYTLEVNKFGQNTAVGLTDETLWEPGGLYTYITAAELVELTSSGAGDEGLQIQVIGLDANWALQDEIVTMDAVDAQANPAPTANTYIRIFRLVNVSSTGSDVTNTISCNGATSATLLAQIAGSNNQTLMSVYSVPAAHTGWLHRLTIDSSEAVDNLQATLFVRPFESVFAVKDLHFLLSSIQHTIERFHGLHGVQDSGIVVPAKGDIELRAKKISGGGTANVTGTFHLILIPN